MKKIAGICSILLLISCSPDAKLIAENEELKLMVEKHTELAMQAAAEATKAQAQAMEAAAEARAAMAEADKQKELAEEALKKCK